MHAEYRSIEDTALTHTQFEKILCPNLRTGVRMGLLNPDKDGWVQESELRTFLNAIGLPNRSVVQNLLVSSGIAAAGSKQQSTINITGFPGTFLDHGSESCVLNNADGYLEQRLELMLSFLNDDDRVYSPDLGRALNEFNQCPFKRKSLLGTHIATFEFGGILEVYWRTDKQTGTKYLTREDIIDLWHHNRFPQGWSLPSKPEVTSLRAFRQYLSMFIGRLRHWRVSCK